MKTLEVLTEEERSKWHQTDRPIAKLTDEELARARRENNRYLRLARMVGIYNISELREMVAAARILSDLTGLLNRDSIEEILRISRGAT